MGNGRNLDEVSFIRPFLIITMVLYHAFCPWTGAWKAFDGFEYNDVYRWIADISYSCLMPTFVAVSGYVWAFLRGGELKSTEDFRTLVSKKFKRLMIPCIVFSIPYVLIFGITQNGDIPHTFDYISVLVNGAGHMWFLPMLFSCFIICWAILSLSIRWRYKMLLAFLLSFFGFLRLPFMAGTALYYTFFMLFGYSIFINRELINRRLSKKLVIGSGIIFIFVFVVISILTDNILLPQYQISSILQKALLMGIMTILRLLYSSLGVLFIFCFSFSYIQTNAISQKVINFGSNCMGIYIFQQFILRFIYYKTELPVILENVFILPWISFAVTMVVSYYLTILIRTTNIGKKLI